MRSKLIFPFTKHWKGPKLEDKLPNSPPSIRRSAWSYSYDLKLNKICEEALQKAIASDCSDAEVEDKSILKLNSENLDDDFFFRRN